jgi:hypothetical protein
LNQHHSTTQVHSTSAFNSFHLGWVIHDIKSSWQDLLATEDLSGFIEKQISELGREIDFFGTTYALIQEITNSPPACGVADHLQTAHVLHGMTIGHLQCIAYLVELVIACFHGQEHVRAKLKCGLVT